MQSLDQVYQTYSDEELKEIIEKNMASFYKIIKSEEIARKIVENEGKYFYYQHKEFKEFFSLLLDYANERKIHIKKCEYIKIDKEEIIKRLEENRDKYIQDTYEYFYKIVDSGNVDENGLCSIRLNLVKMIDEINEFYDNLIRSDRILKR